MDSINSHRRIQSCKLIIKNMQIKMLIYGVLAA